MPGARRQRPPEIFQRHHIGGRNMENRRESLVAFVLFIALLFFCILMGLVPLLAGTPARADSTTFEQFYQVERLEPVQAHMTVNKDYPGEYDLRGYLATNEPCPCLVRFYR
jgi:hypothetical protein